MNVRVDDQATTRECIARRGVRAAPPRLTKPAAMRSLAASKKHVDAMQKRQDAKHAVFERKKRLVEEERLAKESVKLITPNRPFGYQSRPRQGSCEYRIQDHAYYAPVGQQRQLRAATQPVLVQIGHVGPKRLCWCAHQSFYQLRDLLKQLPKASSSQLMRPELTCTLQ